MIVSRVQPAPVEQIDLEESSSRDTLVEWYRPDRTQWLRINLVMSLTGATKGSDGTSESITTRTDRKILGVIRELADVVLVGAQSVRSEHLQVPRHVPIAVLTSTGDLTGHRFAEEDRDRILVLCPATAAERVREQLGIEPVVVTEGDGAMSLSRIVRELRTRGLTSIVCEGGPSLSRGLLNADLVDEVCLTTVATMGGATTGATGIWSSGVRTAVHLRQLLLDEDDTQFARWTIDRS